MRGWMIDQRDRRLVVRMDAHPLFNSTCTAVSSTFVEWRRSRGWGDVARLAGEKNRRRVYRCRDDLFLCCTHTAAAQGLLLVRVVRSKREQDGSRLDFSPLKNGLRGYTTLNFRRTIIPNFSGSCKILQPALPVSRVCIAAVAAGWPCSISRAEVGGGYSIRALETMSIHN